MGGICLGWGYCKVQRRRVGESRSSGIRPWDEASGDEIEEEFDGGSTSHKKKMITQSGEVKRLSTEQKLVLCNQLIISMYL